MFKKFMSKKRNKKRGFTLIELIIVIAIIAILAAIAVPAFGQIRTKANVSSDIGNARSIYSVVTSLIAEETIILPANQTSYKLDKLPTSSGTVDLTTQHLAGVSEPKAYQQTHFEVGLDSQGNVTISVKSDTGSAVDVQIYPNPTGRYAGQTS